MGRRKENNMERIFVSIMAHPLTEEQKEAALKEFSVDRIEEIRSPFNIDPKASTADIEALATEFADKVPEGTTVATVAGELTFTMALTKLLKERGVKVVTATTERVSKERVLVDGSVEKTNVFRHVAFRELP